MNPIYDPGNKNIIPFNKLVDGGVLFSYSVSYELFEKFYEELDTNEIVKCGNCIHHSISLPGTGTALYKFFKIYFVIGFIIAYYYKNPTKFINEEYFKQVSGGLDPTIAYLFKDIMTKVLCNDLYEMTPKCIMVKNMENFIETNKFNVQENIAITRSIFDFVSKIPIVGNMQSIKKMFDPKLRPL